ncbi:MAG: DUF1905 domain-containing protein [Acidobacteriaceae bacterium]
MTASRSRTFQGVLEADGTSLGWTIVRLPFDPTEVWPNRKGLRVRGAIHAATVRRSGPSPVPSAFRTSLFRTRDGGHILLVNQRMQRAAGIARGSVAEVSLEPDTEERVVAPPPELEAVLRQDRALRTGMTNSAPRTAKPSAT